MQKIFKFHGAVGLVVMLGLACSAPAQSPASQPPPSEPYVWRNVVIGGGGFVTGMGQYRHLADENRQLRATLDLPPPPN